ncbi:hypothetical protein Phou_020840 [Phytohabitans houttuyneae]|uniref:Uncharacterized protein n=1 Tax=Phytohabitans houttuyneae TaxID=1076126 RepID=A0A6V8K2H0_9ACTN|nr:hypothetical protein Phou_020840 [Phytohabitans houttuyneae]
MQVAAGAAAVAAAAALVMLLAGQPVPVAEQPPPGPQAVAPLNPPAVAPPASPAPSTVPPSTVAPSRPATPAPVTPPSPSPTPRAVPVTARLEPVGTLVRGRPGVLALTVIHPGQSGGTGGGSALPAAPDTGPLTAQVTLPRGVSLRAGPAGDGWTCAASRCGRAALAAGGTTRAYLPVAVSGTAGGEAPSVRLTAPRARTVAVTAPAGVQATGLPAVFAGTAPAALAVGGNSLLSCGGTSRTCGDARSGQREADNGDYHMTRYADPQAPAGYPYGAAVSAATIPVRGKVLWAGLYWSGTGPRPNEPVARLRPPGADGYVPVSATRVDTASGGDFGAVYQAWADVTSLVRGSRGGTWWVAVDKQAFKGGYNAYGGWALLLVVDGGGPQRTVAVFDGFTPLSRGASYSSPLWAVPGAASVGLVAWEGDRVLAGDRLAVGGAAVGGDNVAAGRADGTPAGWHTLGTDARVLPARPRSPALTASAATDAWLLGPVALVTGPN